MFGELVEWVLNLEPGFAFLLALPFMVAVAGLLSEALRNRRTQGTSRSGADVQTTPHDRHVWSR